MNAAFLTSMILARSAKAFEESTKDPLGTQKRTLFEYLNRNKRTEYGLRYNFSAIRSIKDYQSRIPVVDYEDIRLYVERMARGERNVLTADKVLFFGITSGSTSQPKLIPVTRYSESKKSKVTDLWVYYIVRDHPRIVNGKILAVISPEEEGITEGGIYYGAESGHGYSNLPLFVRNRYALSPAVFAIKDYDARYYCILRIGIEKDVSTVATLNPSTIILLCQKIEKWKDNIINDIEKGTLDEGFDIPEKIRKTLAASLRPNPKRACELKAIAKEKGQLLPKYFWPNLELIECWKGGTVNIYLKVLPQYFGQVAVRDFGCLSTEARSSVPMSDEGAGGVLAIGSNFYEFIPKEDMEKKSKRFLLCTELEKGKEYSLVVTTAGGLYRYNIDDIIRVDGFFNKTPVIQFVQKGLHAASLTGEKLYEAQINEAVTIAVNRSGVAVAFFSTLPESGLPSRYIFLAEFLGEASADKKRQFLKSVEEELCRQNAEYRDKRRAQLLGAPLLKIVAKGGFEKYRARKIEEGAHDGQFKMPELVSDPGFENNFTIDEELSMG